MIRLLMWFFGRRKGAGLIFSEAWVPALAGERIRRNAWAPGAYIRVLSCDERDFVYLYWRGPGGYKVKFWQPYAVDFAAKDWEVF